VKQPRPAEGRLADVTVSLHRPANLEALGDAWRALEREADGSFFTSWTWVGCQAVLRFDDPVVLEARSANRTAALALCNRRNSRVFGETLWLGESGDRELDSIFVEHNGPLVARGTGAAVVRHCLNALVFRGYDGGCIRTREIVMSGIGEELLLAAGETGAHLQTHASRLAPRIEFSQIAGPYLDALSPNTRYQIRRSGRRYADRGQVRLTRAATLSDAHAFLDGLIHLHQAYWRGRMRPGAFANPRFVSFHRELLDRGFARNEIDLLRIDAGADVVGYLYSFCYRGRVYAYQSGFDYDGITPHHKPGLTSHHLAIEHYRKIGASSYDFLGGADRYKLSMANACDTLTWLRACSKRSLRARLRTVGDYVRARTARNGANEPG
jgi:CelD/BcsL family acetyltransferase involved in cellulose biosynthesis